MRKTKKQLLQHLNKENHNTRNYTKEELNGIKKNMD